MTALQFVNAVCRMMGYPQVDSIETTQETETADVILAADSVLSNIQGDRNWPELAVDAHLSMASARSTVGIVTTAYGSTTLSAGVGTFIAGDLGSVVMVSNSKTSYRIAAYIASNQVTLDRAWVEDAICGVESTVFVGQDSYELPIDYDRMLVEKFYNPIEENHVVIVDPNELSVAKQILGLGMSIGAPAKCTIHGLNTAGTARKVHFDVVPQNNYDLEYKYQKKHAQLTTNAQLISYPEKDMLYIQDLVAARLDRDSEANKTAGQIAADAMSARNKSQQNQESGSGALRIVPVSRRHGRRRRR